MTEEEFLNLTREFWDDPKIELDWDLATDVSRGDEESCVEFLLALEGSSGQALSVDLSRHIPRIWSIYSIFDGILPQKRLRKWGNFEPLLLSEVFGQLNSFRPSDSIV